MAIVSPRASSFTSDFPDVEIDWDDDVEHRRKLAEKVNGLNDGKDKATGIVTLDTLSATTTLADRRIGPSSTILFSSKTANAAAGYTALYVSSQGQGTATLTHANSSQADRTYRYAVRG